jgi:unsaturated rhamnogalacturonyl hydrolase
LTIAAANLYTIVPGRFCKNYELYTQMRDRHESLQPAKTLRRLALSASLTVLTLVFQPSAWAQQHTLPQRIANSAIHRLSGDLFNPPNEKQMSMHERGLLLNGMNALWYDTADPAYYQYLKRSVDQLLASDSSMPNSDLATDTLIQISLGRQLLLLYRVTQEEKYYKAATHLREQLAMRARSPSNAPLYKETSPDHLRLGEIYMAEPFLAEYALIFQRPLDLVNVTEQFSYIEQQILPKPGRAHSERDLALKESPADEGETSPIFWTRGMSRFMMALVDSLPYYTQNDPGRATLLAILNRSATVLARYQDKSTGLWSRTPDDPKEKKIYVDSSSACMLIYAFQKGVRLGYLSQQYSSNATRAWQTLLSNFVETDANGDVIISGTVKEIDLRGDTHHAETYRYQPNSKAPGNDPKEIGEFLLASTEMELAPTANLARGETVMLDAWFNSQQRRNAAGQQEYFHYKWNDYSNSGFSIFGHILASHGATLDTLYDAPTMERLRQAQYYIIASPDIPSKNPHPHYMTSEDADQVAAWVKQGGILILMENDPPNADIEHFNSLASRFGIHFNNVLSHHVIDDQFEAGMISVTKDGPIFQHPHSLYMKDTCTLSTEAPARSLLESKNDIVMATAKYGKGTVFAVVDPWLYNEYTDGRRTLPQQDNYAAGKEFVAWLFKQTSRDRPPIN